MSVLETSNDIIKDITKLKIDSENDKQYYCGGLGYKKGKEDNLNITKERKWSMRDMQISNDAIPIPTSPRNNKQLRITYLRTVIKYLDYQSMFNLSLVNKEFYSFLTSIYFYKFISQVKEGQKNNKTAELNTSFSSNNSLFASKKKGGGFLSALTGALSIFAPVTDNTTKKEPKLDIKEIRTRIELHEKVLNEKMRNLQISKEIIDIRTNIDKLIEERYQTKNKEDSSDDKEIEKIKREKIEATYLELKREVDALNTESIKLKNRYEILQKQDIDKEMKLNMLGNYIKNNFTTSKVSS